MQRTRAWVLHSRGLPPFSWLYRAYYHLGLAFFLIHCRRQREILRARPRRGFTQRGWEPGLSDIDLYVVIRTLPPDVEARFLRRFWLDVARLKRAFPFLGEVQIIAEDEEEAALAWPGARAEDYPGRPETSDDPWRQRLAMLTESLNACLFGLEETWCSTAHEDLAWRHKLEKYHLDALRFGAAGTGEPLLSRQEQRSEAVSRRALAGLQPPDADRLLVETLRAVDERCDRFIRRAREAGLCDRPALAPPSRWPDDLPNSEFFAWRTRVRRFEAGRLSAVRGLYYDGGSRWYLLVDTHDAENLRIAAREAAALRREDTLFAAPPILASPAMFQMLLWTCHLDSPFLYTMLSPGLSPLRVAVRARSAYPLASWDRRAQRAQWNLVAGDYAPPPARFLEAAIGQSAADLARSLRLYSSPEWAGDNAYRLCHLYGRLLALRLYQRFGLASDPEDLDRLVGEWTRRAPENAGFLDALRRALETPAAEFNARAAAECFEDHLPVFRRLLADALAFRRSDGGAKAAASVRSPASSAA